MDCRFFPVSSRTFVLQCGFDGWDSNAANDRYGMLSQWNYHNDLCSLLFSSTGVFGIWKLP